MRFGTQLMTFAFVASHCGGLAAGAEKTITLAGAWRFQTDPKDVGEQQRWFNRRLAETITLPGSMTENGLGDLVTADTPWTGTVRPLGRVKDLFAPYRKPGNVKIPYWLQPDRHYVGAAWVQREVTIPKTWAGRRIVLFLERCHWVTSVWLDDRAMGTRNSLSVPHEYDLTAALTPGTHTLSIRIDNRVKLDVGENAHSVSDNTQTNWNGIVGAMELRAGSPVWIDDVQVYPDVRGRKARVRVEIRNATGARFEECALTIQAWTGERVDEKGLPKRVIRISPDRVTALQAGPAKPIVLSEDYLLGDGAQRWDEHSPALYTLVTTIECKTDGHVYRDQRTVRFGLREVGTNGTRITLNGDPIYLRGTLECAIFPKTGYPPTDLESWMKILRKVKACGLNHLRFHSWCPPEAAFQAADRMGVLFQVEGPFWSHGISNDPKLDAYIKTECDRILKTYGNHPSFCFMAYGNEPGGKKYKQVLADLVMHWKASDSRRLYTAASGWPILPENEYHVTPRPRVNQWGDGLRNRYNSKPYESTTDYDDFVAKYDVPVVSHEIGEWCVYPNFAEIKKYTGPLKPCNFEIFRETLDANGMGDLAHDFLMASGKLQAICYKEEIEAALRTKGFGGFQLLDLHDFPGQGTALVGCLDPFWDEKGYITYDEYRRFSGPSVPLVRMKKCIWTTDETFAAEAEITHYGADPFVRVEPRWRIENNRGDSVAKGTFAEQTIPRGTALSIGHIEAKLAGFHAPGQFKLTLEIPDTEASNSWSLWVYPSKVDTQPGADIRLVRSLDSAVKLLANGAKVLLVPKSDAVAGDKAGPVPAGWAPIFWNTIWTGFQPPHTLGLLCDPANPALALFPTEYHSNWQWWDLVHGSGIFILDTLPGELRPIVRVIDDWVTNRRLGLIFEANVNGGKLLVCGSDIVSDLDARPVARQIRHSLLQYMASDAFKPTVTLTRKDLGTLFR